MDLSFLVRGLIVGFTVAVGVGPISLLTIRRTLVHGRVYGLASGIGVASADATYGAIAAFGLSAVTAVLVGARPVLALVGGVFLIWLGLRTILAGPATATAGNGMTSGGAAEAPPERPGLLAAWASIYGLTMTNPMTILSFAAIFAGFGLAGGTLADAALLTIGVFLGSTAWWLSLTSVVAAVRTRLTRTALLGLNRVSGAGIVAFGVIAIGVAAGGR
jgi:threonine/homoserine/homoserine lactone efflux protein